MSDYWGTLSGGNVVRVESLDISVPVISNVADSRALVSAATPVPCWKTRRKSLCSPTSLYSSSLRTAGTQPTCYFLLSYLGTRGKAFPKQLVSFLHVHWSVHAKLSLQPIVFCSSSWSSLLLTPDFYMSLNGIPHLSSVGTAWLASTEAPWLSTGDQGHFKSTIFLELPHS